jgi:hypothetical protein
MLQRTTKRCWTKASPARSSLRQSLQAAGVRPGQQILRSNLAWNSVRTRIVDSSLHGSLLPEEKWRVSRRQARAER